MSARVTDDHVRVLIASHGKDDGATRAALRELLAYRARDLEPRPLREGDEWAYVGETVALKGKPEFPECARERIVRVPIAATPESAPAERRDHELGLCDEATCSLCAAYRAESAPAEKRLLPYEEDLEDPRIVGYPDPPQSAPAEKAYKGIPGLYLPSGDAPASPPEPVTCIGRAAPEPVEHSLEDLAGMVRDRALKLMPEAARLGKLEARVTCLEHGHVWGAQVVHACNPPRLAPRTCTRCGRREVHVEPVAGGWQVQS